MALHVVLGGVYLALAPFQFARRIRSRHLGYHRRVGRLLVAIGVVVAIGLAIATQRVILFPALMITMSDPTDGRFESLLVATLAFAFVVHASVAETWIRATRRSGAPKAGEVKSV